MSENGTGLELLGFLGGTAKSKEAEAQKKLDQYEYLMEKGELLTDIRFTQEIKEKMCIRDRSRMNRKNGGIPRRRTDMRGSGNWIRELVKRSIHAPYVWRNSPGSAVRMPGQRKKLDVLMLYRPGPGVRFHHPEAVLEAV